MQAAEPLRGCKFRHIRITKIFGGIFTKLRNNFYTHMLLEFAIHCKQPKYKVEKNCRKKLRVYTLKSSNQMSRSGFEKCDFDLLSETFAVIAMQELSDNTSYFCTCTIKTLKNLTIH